MRRELDEYFEGRRREFGLPLDLRVAPFHEDVLRELARVPYGRTDTYGHLAALVGRPKAARAVGTVMNRNPIPIVLPCHRIVGANGSLTGYAGGLDTEAPPAGARRDARSFGMPANQAVAHAPLVVDPGGREVERPELAPEP